MTRRIVSDPEHSVTATVNLPIETTDLTEHQIAQVAGAGGCYPFPDDDTSEEFDSPLEDILEDWEDVFNPWPWPFNPWPWPM